MNAIISLRRICVRFPLHLALSALFLTTATGFVTVTPPAPACSAGLSLRVTTNENTNLDRLNNKSIQSIKLTDGRNNNAFGMLMRVRGESETDDASCIDISRQKAIRTVFGRIPTAAMFGTVMLASSSPPASAKASIKPDVAFQNLLKAREELNVASANYLSKKDYDGLREFLTNDAVNMNNYEENANVLLASKQLDAESKIAIGTIRRYGVGADVIIMYGGVKAEINEDIDVEDVNYGAVSKSLKRTMDSLDEVIAICRSNGF